MPDAAFLERLRQNRLARVQELHSASAGSSGKPVAPGVPFVAGDLVFDIVSGLEGEVVAGTRQNVVIQAPQR